MFWLLNITPINLRDWCKTKSLCHKEKIPWNWFVSIATKPLHKSPLSKTWKIHQKHKYSYGNVISVVIDRLNKKNIKLNYKRASINTFLTLDYRFSFNKNWWKICLLPPKIGKSEHYTIHNNLLILSLRKLKRPSKLCWESKKIKIKDNPRHIGNAQPLSLPHSGTQRSSFTGLSLLTILYHAWKM